MSTLKVALIGFGNVGQGLARILIDSGDRIEAETGVKISIVAISDVQKGSVADSNGLNLTEMVRLAESGQNLEEAESPNKGWNALTTIRDSGADAIAELAWTDLTTGQPAISHAESAIENGIHFVTSNKGPFALAGKRLLDLANEKGVMLRGEGTVVSGTPVLNLARGPMAGIGISAVKGILNGTTNYMLCEMESGKTYDEALTQAQELGYAEADPTGDVEGWDAAGKVTILANLLMDGDLGPQDVDREGITGLTPSDIEQAKVEGKRWKLIGEVRRVGNFVEGSVKPVAVALDDPLAAISGATNALTFETELMGPITIVGAGAGRVETGYSILTDLLEIGKEVA